MDIHIFSTIRSRSTGQEAARPRAFIIASSISVAAVLFIILLLAVYMRHRQLNKRKLPPITKCMLLQEKILPIIPHGTNHRCGVDIQITKPPPCTLALNTEAPVPLSRSSIPGPRYTHPPKPRSFQDRSPPGFQWRRKCPPKLGPLLEVGSTIHLTATTTTQNHESSPEGQLTAEPTELNLKAFRGSLDELSTISTNPNRSFGPTRTVFAHTYADEPYNGTDSMIPSPSLCFSVNLDLEGLVFPPDAYSPEPCQLSRSRTRNSSIVLLPGSSPDSPRGSRIASGGSKSRQVTASVISRWRRVRDVPNYPEENLQKGDNALTCSISPTWSEYLSYMKNLQS